MKLAVWIMGRSALPMRSDLIEDVKITNGFHNRFCKDKKKYLVRCELDDKNYLIILVLRCPLCIAWQMVIGFLLALTVEYATFVVRSFGEMSCLSVSLVCVKPLPAVRHDRRCFLV